MPRRAHNEKGAGALHTAAPWCLLSSGGDHESHANFAAYSQRSLAAELCLSKRFERALSCQYPTTHDLIFATSLLAVTIPAVAGSLTLAGNIAYMGLFPPHAQNELGASASQIIRAMRIVLLIANGVWLTIYAIGAPLSVYVLAKHADYPVGEAIATDVVCLFILASNFAYIWRSRRHAHNEKGTNALHAPAPHG